MSVEDIDRVQQQLAEMQRIIEEERARHAEEARLAQERITMLEGRLMETSQAKLRDQIEQRAATQRRVESRSTVTKRSSTTATASTSTAMRTSTASAQGGGRSGAGAGAAAAIGSTSTGGRKAPPSEVSDSPSANARQASGASNNGGTPRDPKRAASPVATRPATAGGSPVAAHGFTSTALQHAWDKFCVKARGEFTVKEISLLSCDTLKLLMEYYNFRDPVEVAQVEAQWALLQEGRDAAYQATPHDGGPKRRSRSFSPVLHKEEFNIDIKEARKPHLSHRVSLSKDGGPKGCDPNTAVERHRTPSPGGKGNMRHSPPTSSDPNRHSPDRFRMRPSGKRSFPEMGESRFEQKVYPRGKARTYSPDPAPVGPFPVDRREDQHGGVRKFNVTYSPDHKDRGVRIGYSPNPREERPRMKRFVPEAKKTNIISLA